MEWPNSHYYYYDDDDKEHFSGRCVRHFFSTQFFGYRIYSQFFPIFTLPQTFFFEIHDYITTLGPALQSYN